MPLFSTIISVTHKNGFIYLASRSKHTFAWFHSNFFCNRVILFSLMTSREERGKVEADSH